MQGIIDRLRQRKEREQQYTALEWSKTVDDMARGEEPNEDALLELLERVGRTIDDLQAAVALKVRRIALRKILDGRPAHSQQVAELDRQLRIENQKRDAALSAFSEAHARIIAQAAPFYQFIGEADAAEKTLRDTCPRQETIDAIAEQQQVIDQLNRERAANQRAEAERNKGLRILDVAGTTFNKRDVEKLRREGKAIVEAADEAAREIERIEAEIDQAAQRKRSLEETLIDP